MPAQTAWPEGVIARYLTLVGATVDITHQTQTQDGTKKETRAACTGCKAATTHTWADSYPNYRRPGVTHYQNQDKGDGAARAWAQSHSETCRALPAPMALPLQDPVDEPDPKRRLWFLTLRKSA